MALSKQIIKNRLAFLLNSIKFKYFLNNTKLSLNNVNENENSNSYIFILSPWALNTIPFFNIGISILLYKRKHSIQFVIDDLQFENEFDHKMQVRMIAWCLNSLKELRVKIEYLSTYNNISISQDENKMIEKLAFANAIHKNRGEENSVFFKQMVFNNTEALKKNFLKIKRYIKENTDHIYILPGGIYGNSGLFEKGLKENGISYFTFDAFFSVLISTYKGIAAQFSDIPVSLGLLLNDDTEEQTKAFSYAKDEFEKRRHGTNKLNSQYQAFEKSENFENVGILMPLNSPWDSAALNIGSVFNSYNEWLLETVDVILKNSDFNITIRQHPDERLWWGKTKTDFKELLDIRFNDSRIQFVSCFDKINSYALLEKSEAVVCYSSTFGIEAAMVGKPVCVCSNVYYSALGFVHKAEKVEDIVFFIKNINSGSIKADQYKAALTYYLAQKSNWLFTPFTPMSSDFDAWLKLGINKLLIEPEVMLFLESLEKQIPLSYISHKIHNHEN
jgi:hypothetical protein